MSRAQEIPIIDMSSYGLGVIDPDSVGDDEVQDMADKICEALSTIGFCYITNHGISDRMIARMKNSSKAFFELPREEKTKYYRPAAQNHGYIALEREQVSPDRPADFKEAYNYSPSNDLRMWPDVPEGFEETVKSFYDECRSLALRILDLLSLGLNLPERHYFRKRHDHIGQTDNPTMVRSLYYPPLPPEAELKPGQIRCGEHTDYGIMTFLFQDDVGGLEVKNLKGNFVPATPIPGTVLINLGDMMQRWTGDQLKATVHRVVTPMDEMRGKSRQSVAYFIHPNDDVLITSLNNSDRYSPIHSVDYLTRRLTSTIADEM